MEKVEITKEQLTEAIAEVTKLIIEDAAKDDVELKILCKLIGMAFNKGLIERLFKPEVGDGK